MTQISTSNIVNDETLRQVQLETLNLLKNSLINSFGPKGSNTVISKMDAMPKYTKDGYTIISNIQFSNGIIEQNVVQQIIEVARNIVKRVGDGTTSAVIMSALIYEELCKTEFESGNPGDIVQLFQKCVKTVCDIIIKHGRTELTLDDIYNIALIATNNNTEIALNIRHIYETHGYDVFIDVGISNDENNLLKEYDGMTLETGFSDVAYVNDKKDGTCTIRKPQIFVFGDPIDNTEMISLFNSIISANVTVPNPIPTVIMAPKISRDLSGMMEQLIVQLRNYPENLKPPFEIITNIYQTDQFNDIAMLCGAKTIKKYIDPNIQKQDIEKGLAPTPQNIRDFAGTADMVVSDALKSKFVNPGKMFANAEHTEYSDEFNALLGFLEDKLKEAYANNESANTTGNLKRRINSLKANMVDYLIGGATVADRDSVRDLVEDAVLSCRSAVRDGVGYGANYEGLRATGIMAEKMLEGDEGKIYDILYNAYLQISELLYKDSGNPRATVYRSCAEECPLNLRTGEFDKTVLTSIQSDVVVLDAISRIVTLVFTSNQFLTPDPVMNLYL